MSNVLPVRFWGDAVVGGYCGGEAIRDRDQVCRQGGRGIAICGWWLLFGAVFKGFVDEVEKPVGIEEDVVWDWFNSFR